MWATLALLTELSGAVPAFQLTAMSFSIAFLIGAVAWWRLGGSPIQYLRLPKAVWTLGITGLFGYHLSVLLYRAEESTRSSSKFDCLFMAAADCVFLGAAAG